MLRKLAQWRGAVADYTLGTIIVVAHMMTAELRERRGERLRPRQPPQLRD